MVSSAIQFWGYYCYRFARDDYIFGITDYVLSFERGIYFLYENLENVDYNHNFNAHEVIRTSNFSLCQPS